MKSKFSALVVDSDMESRARLKDAMRAAGGFEQLSTAKSLEDALKQLSSDKVFDIIFVSHRLELEGISHFIGQAKRLPNACDSAFILLQSSATDSGAFTVNLLRGHDGFLIEPYSVDSLVEVMALAEQVRSERRQARLILALRLFVRELILQFSQLVRLRRMGHRAGISYEVFKNMCSVLRSLEPDMEKLYFEIILETFPAIEAPSHRELSSKTYSGASERIRRKLSEKMLDRVKQAFSLAA